MRGIEWQYTSLYVLYGLVYVILQVVYSGIERQVVLLGKSVVTTE